MQEIVLLDPKTLDDHVKVQKAFVEQNIYDAIAAWIVSHQHLTKSQARSFFQDAYGESDIKTLVSYFKDDPKDNKGDKKVS